MPLALTAGIAASAAGAIVGEHRGLRRLVYGCKPAATLLILVLAATAPDPVSRTYQALVVAGLLLSLAGDVFLMLPRDRFVAGLAAFLLAHLAYIAAFAPGTISALGLAGLGVLLIAAALLVRGMWPRLGTLRVPVLLYAAALTAMAWQALERYAALGTAAALAAAVGAGLFVVSDAVLAWERFVRRSRWSGAVVMATYYAAQWLIARSVNGR